MHKYNIKARNVLIILSRSTNKILATAHIKRSFILISPFALNDKVSLIPHCCDN